MNYDGDPALVYGLDGFDLLVEDGQPFMDSGLKNALTISLFTEPNWWGNVVSKKEERIGSDFIGSVSGKLTNLTRLNAEEAARGATKWLIEQGIAKTISLETAIPAVERLYLELTTERPDGKAQSFAYQINWQALALEAGL